MYACLSLCTTVVHDTAQNSSDNFPSYTSDNHNSWDDGVYWRGGGWGTRLTYMESRWLTVLNTIRELPCGHTRTQQSDCSTHPLKCWVNIFRGRPITNIVNEYFQPSLVSRGACQNAYMFDCIVRTARLLVIVGYIRRRSLQPWQSWYCSHLTLHRPATFYHVIVLLSSS